MHYGGRRNIIGKNLKRLRIAAGLRQEDLAARCFFRGFDVSRSQISHVENGIRGVSDLELALFAQALRVSIIDLMPKRLPRWKKDSRAPRPDDD